MFCAHCGSEVRDEAVVCIHCGCAIIKPRPVAIDERAKIEQGKREQKIKEQEIREQIKDKIDKDVQRQLAEKFGAPIETSNNPKLSCSTLKSISKTLMVISTCLWPCIYCFIAGFTFINNGVYSNLFLALPFLIPLCWHVPIVCVYCKKINRREYISTGFKFCILFFVNFISGILLLCDKEDVEIY